MYLGGHLLCVSAAADWLCICFLFRLHKETHRLIKPCSTQASAECEGVKNYTAKEDVVLLLDKALWSKALSSCACMGMNIAASHHHPSVFKARETKKVNLHLV